MSNLQYFYVWNILLSHTLSFLNICRYYLQNREIYSHFRFLRFLNAAVSVVGTTRCCNTKYYTNTKHERLCIFNIRYVMQGMFNITLHRYKCIIVSWYTLTDHAEDGFCMGSVSGSVYCASNNEIWLQILRVNTYTVHMEKPRLHIRNQKSILLVFIFLSSFLVVSTTTIFPIISPGQYYTADDASYGHFWCFRKGVQVMYLVTTLSENVDHTQPYKTYIKDTFLKAFAASYFMISNCFVKS